MKKKSFNVFFSVTGAVVITKVMGLLKQIVIASTFGADAKTDIISLSEGFVSNIQYAILQSIVTAFVAVFIHANSDGKDKRDRFVSDSINFFCMVSLLTVVILEIIAPLISKIIAPNYTEDLTIELSKYLRLFAPILFFFTVISLFHAVLNATHRFIPGELIGFNQSIIIIFLVLCVGSKIGVDVLVIGTYVYSLWNIFFLYLFGKDEIVVKKGANPLHNPDIKKMMVMIGPLLFGFSMVFLNQQVDKIIVSGMEEGTVTAMHYGAVLTNLVTAIIASICTVLFTKITEHIAQTEKDKVAAVVEKAMVILISIFLPITLATFFSANDIVKIVFGHGSFDTKAIDSTAMALKGYAVSFVPLVIKNLFCRIQYGEQKTTIPMVISSIGIVFNIILSIVLSKVWGVFGVTFSSSIAEVICAILNVMMICYEYRYIKFTNIFKSIPIICVTMIIDIVLIRSFLSYLDGTNEFLRFCIVSFIALSVFMIMFLVFFRKKYFTKSDEHYY